LARSLPAGSFATSEIGTGNDSAGVTPTSGNRSGQTPDLLDERLAGRDDPVATRARHAEH